MAPYISSTRTEVLRRRSMQRAKVGARTMGAHVGSEAVAQHVLRTDADVNSTATDLRLWQTDTLKAISQRARDGSVPGCSIGAPVENCMTPKENELNRFIITTWEPFNKRWKDYASDTRFYSWDEDEVHKYDVELASYRDKIKALMPAALKTEITPPSTKPDGSSNGLFGGGTALNNVVWLAGMGFAFYIVSNTIAPSLLGGAARTKSAYRAVKEA